MKKCLNCGSPTTKNYCAECGQKTSERRITSRFLFEEVVHFFTHFEKGFYETTKLVIINPGKVLGMYLKGERKKFNTPMGFLIIWITLQVLCRKWGKDLFNYHWTFRIPSDGPNKTIFNDYPVLFTLVILPIAAFIHYIILARPRFNYAEVLVMFIYITSGLLFLLTVNDLILGWALHINMLSYQIQLYEINIIIGLYNLWFCLNFYWKRRMKYFWPRLLLNLVITLVTIDRLTVAVPWFFRKLHIIH